VEGGALRDVLLHEPGAGPSIPSGCRSSINGRRRRCGSTEGGDDPVVRDEVALGVLPAVPVSGSSTFSGSTSPACGTPVPGGAVAPWGGMLTPGISTTVTRTSLLACGSSTRSEEVNPWTAYSAPRQADCGASDLAQDRSDARRWQALRASRRTANPASRTTDVPARRTAPGAWAVGLPLVCGQECGSSTARGTPAGDPSQS
jgi:hypothetical protein